MVYSVMSASVLPVHSTITYWIPAVAVTDATVAGAVVLAADVAVTIDEYALPIPYFVIDCNAKSYDTLGSNQLITRLLLVVVIYV